MKISFFKLFLITTTVDAGTFDGKFVEFKTSQSFGYKIVKSVLSYLAKVVGMVVSTVVAGVSCPPQAVIEKREIPINREVMNFFIIC